MLRSGIRLSTSFWLSGQGDFSSVVRDRRLILYPLRGYSSVIARSIQLKLRDLSLAERNYYSFRLLYTAGNIRCEIACENRLCTRSESSNVHLSCLFPLMGFLVATMLRISTSQLAIPMLEYSVPRSLSRINLP